MRFPWLGIRLGVIAASAVLVASPAAAVDAATAPAPTMIVLQPIPVSYGHMQTTVQGVLEVQSSTPSQRLPVPGKTISISVTAHDGTTTALGSATTGSDGSFSLAATLPALGLVRATFAGDPAYAPASGIRYASPAYLPTQVSLDPLPATVSGMTHLTVTGSAQMQTPGGTWAPAADTSVVVHGSGTNYRAFTMTDANGQFTASFWVEDPGPLEADSTQDWYSFAGAAQSPSVPLAITPTPTRVTGFHATSTPEIAQDGLGFTTHVDAWATDGGSNFWTGANEADLYFQARGQTAWTEMASSLVTFPDTATFGLPAYLPDGRLAQGSWQVRVPASPVCQASESPVITVPVRIQTWLNSIRLTRSGSRHFLAGTLDDQPSSSPLASQAIKLYYRYPGHTRWHYSRTVTTSQAGNFALKLPATKRWYKAVYPGAGNYLTIQSKGLYFP